MVSTFVVGAERVGAEVVSRVMPHRVDVVRLVLAVVVLDEERRAVQPVVVRLARIDRPRPCEVHAVDARLAEPAQLLLGELAPHVAGVDLDETDRERSLLAAPLAERDAGRRLEALTAARAADDVTERLRGDDETAAQARVQAAQE